MNDLYKKSLHTLELHRVLDMLAAEAVSDMAKDAARALEPMRLLEDIQDSQRETTDAKMLMGLRSAPSFSGVRDINGVVTRAELGGALNIMELLGVAALLRAARGAKAYLAERSDMKTSLDHLFRALRANRTLEEKIDMSFLNDEEVADGASADLASIRRSIRAANSRVRETLQKIITSPAYSKALQEPIITMRSGRYVVPVKQEYRAELPGMVHDV